jgi:hypothetical protein
VKNNPHITYRMLPKKLSALRVSEQQISRPTGDGRDADEIFWPNDAFELRPDEMDEGDSHPEAIRCVVAAAFEAATSAAVRRRLHHGQALAVAVLVPGPFWVAPTSSHFGETFGSRWRLIRPLSIVAGRRPTNTEVIVASELSHGQSVAGISADVRALPRSLVLSADITIRIVPPSPAVLCSAIRRFTNRAATEDLLDNIGADLDLVEIVACFRPGSGPQRIAQRLVAAAAALKRLRSETEADGPNFPSNPSADAGANQKETE